MIEFENKNESIVTAVVSLEIARRRVTGTVGLYICRCLPLPVVSEPALNCRS